MLHIFCRMSHYFFPGCTLSRNPLETINQTRRKKNPLSGEPSWKCLRVRDQHADTHWIQNPHHNNFILLHTEQWKFFLQDSSILQMNQCLYSCPGQKKMYRCAHTHSQLCSSKDVSINIYIYLLCPIIKWLSKVCALFNSISCWRKFYETIASVENYKEDNDSLIFLLWRAPPAQPGPRQKK